MDATKDTELADWIHLDDNGPVLAKLSALLKLRENAVTLKEMECNGTKWFWAVLVFTTKDPSHPLFVIIDLYVICYRPAGPVTPEDVRALGDRWRHELMRPVVVVAGEDGFEPKALASLKRSKWIDYFDGNHIPARWSAEVARRARVQDEGPTSSS